jgi:hypothetical protein
LEPVFSRFSHVPGEVICMMNHVLGRSIVIALLCALPLPAVAQIPDGLVLSEHATQGLVRERLPKTYDRDKDSLKNGAIIGAVVVGAWCLVICGQGLDSTGRFPLAVAAGAGMGALIGASIDSRFSRGHRVTFRWRF